MNDNHDYLFEEFIQINFYGYILDDFNDYNQNDNHEITNISLIGNEYQDDHPDRSKDGTLDELQLPIP